MMLDVPLTGRAILVVEDEYYIADDLRRELVRAGATVVGPAPSLTKALTLIASGAPIDGAILDINLGGEAVFPAADLLRERGIPTLFATGYDDAAVPPRFDDVARCEKPMGPEAVRRRLVSLLHPH